MKYTKGLIICLLMVFVNITGVLASTITPSSTSVELLTSQTTFTFDLSLNETKSFAGAEFTITSSSSDLKLTKVDYIDVKSANNIPIKQIDNTYYFGFYASEDKFSGNLKVATLTFDYTGKDSQSIALTETKIVRYNNLSVTTADSSSAGFNYLVTRKSSGSSSSTSTSAITSSTTATPTPTIIPSSTPAIEAINNNVITLSKNLSGASLKVSEVDFYLSQQTVQSLLNDKYNDVTLNATKTDNSNIPSVLSNTIENRPVYDISIKGNDNYIKSLGENEISISIPYSIANNEDTNSMIVYLIDEQGKYKQIKTSYYDDKKNAIVVKTNSLGKFAIGYNYKNFNDTNNH